jgi:protein-S-isoprenylcysteine O-methyltransferase Ste14
MKLLLSGALLLLLLPVGDAYRAYKARVRRWI